MIKMMMRPVLGLMALALLLFNSPAFAAADAALVTSLAGKVSRAGAEGQVDAFVKLKAGDVLTLAKDTKIQLTYFENGRQESWAGAGKLEVGASESKATGLPAAQVKQVPMVIVKQLARTPSLDSQGRAGVMRLRAIPTPDAIARMEDTYKQMRAESDKSGGKDDLNPELYLLAGMLEMRQLERVEQLLADMKKDRGNDPEAKLLVSLYGKALKDVRAAAK